MNASSMGVGIRLSFVVDRLVDKKLICKKNANKSLHLRIRKAGGIPFLN
jgi:hypothetical protein